MAVHAEVHDVVRTVLVVVHVPGAMERPRVEVRVEVLRAAPRDFYPRVWFRELVRLAPTQPLLAAPRRRVCMDVQVEYLEESLGFEELRRRSARAVVEAVRARLLELHGGGAAGPSARRGAQRTTGRRRSSAG